MIHKTEQEINEILRDLASLCQSSKDAKTVAEMVVRQHRTHQQSLGRFILESIVSFSDSFDKGHFDLRNEATCKMCKEVSEEIKDHGLPFI